MFASDLSFSKAVMADRCRARSTGAPRRVYRLPDQRPSARQSASRGR